MSGTQSAISLNICNMSYFVSVLINLKLLHSLNISGLKYLK